MRAKAREPGAHMGVWQGDLSEVDRSATPASPRSKAQQRPISCHASPSVARATADGVTRSAQWGPRLSPIDTSLPLKSQIVTCCRHGEASSTVSCDGLFNGVDRDGGRARRFIAAPTSADRGGDGQDNQGTTQSERLMAATGHAGSSLEAADSGWAALAGVADGASRPPGLAGACDVAARSRRLRGRRESAKSGPPSPSRNPHGLFTKQTDTTVASVTDSRPGLPRLALSTSAECVVHRSKCHR